MLTCWSLSATGVLRSQDSLLGFDCSSSGVAASPVDLLEVDPCDTHADIPDDRVGVYQVVQTSKKSSVLVKTCRIHQTLTITRCGMHSHIMIVYGPSVLMDIDVGKSVCEEIHRSLRWEYLPRQYTDRLTVNSTTRFVTIEAGSRQSDGSCEGVSYTYAGATYHKVYVSSEYIIEIREGTSHVDVSRNQILLPEGLNCRNSDTTCYDRLVGRSYWTEKTTYCAHGFLSELYGGQAKVIKINNTEDFIKVNQDGFIFVSKLYAAIDLCGDIGRVTDYQNVYVITGTHARLHVPKVPSYLINPTLYVNTKINYLQYALIDDMKQVYHDTIRQLCLVEKQVLENKFNLARLTGGSLSHLIGFGPRGTFLQVSGEVAHIIRCPIAKVSLRHTNSCYSAIPITYNNSSVFLTPITRIISPNSTQVTCSIVAPMMFKMESA
ncbi:hypothetical protein JTE90_024723 [Oedothorax gibbosus]|uniref:Uncharacterized protein n=1 Tax=Oedothorax gibbosus TaxID=931172 RepID=A0AAV6U9I5_9ARAC|nr:hypothetical protein JTE90_024723 [Oedothorax gibbosus]